MATKTSHRKSKVTRQRKLFRVLKRKWKKPALYTIALSLLIYMGVSNLLLQQKMRAYHTPRFVITRISNDFDEMEFMHLLLTVQEIQQQPKVFKQLVAFVNRPFPSPCPRALENQLNRMNWASTAFHIRVKKMFDMYDVYDHINRLNDTIAFLSQEIEEERLPISALDQVSLLKAERDRIFQEDMSPEEYDFVAEYGGLILALKASE